MKYKIEKTYMYLVKYKNGDKWLTKETCKTQKEADDLVKALNERDANA